MEVDEIILLHFLDVEEQLLVPDGIARVSLNTSSVHLQRSSAYRPNVRELNRTDPRREARNDERIAVE